MKVNVNVARPLQILQWYSYIIIIFFVQLVIILPLSFILFNDFYNRIISSDSIQTIPLSIFASAPNYNFHQNIKRYDFDSLLTANEARVIDNGLPQNIPLRSDITYHLNMNLEFYCQLPSIVEESKVHQATSRANAGSHKLVDQYENSQLLNTITFKIWRNDNPNDLLYKVKLPVICSSEENGGDLNSVINTSSLQPSVISNEVLSFKQRYHNNWINKLQIEDKIKISSGTRCLHFEFQTAKPVSSYKKISRKRLVFEPESNIEFRTVFDQGIRNLMLRHSFITYTIGVAIVYFIILMIFVLTAVGMFVYVTVNDKQNTFSMDKLAKKQ